MSAPRPLVDPSERHIEVPRHARYYVLGDESAVVNEIWYVLHGFGQLAGGFIRYFADLAEGPRLVVAPEALNRYYTADLSVPAHERAVGATWMTREDRDTEMRDYIRYLDLLHERFAADHSAARTVVVGFSQGGATAARWAARGASTIDRLILWGATLPPDLDVNGGKGIFSGAPLTLVIGEKDQHIHSDALERESTRLDAAGIPFDLVRFDGGHSIKRAVLKQLAG
jgi:predicted esterase